MKLFLNEFAILLIMLPVTTTIFASNQDIHQQLLNAAQKGDGNLVITLLNQKADPCVTFGFLKETPLMLLIDAKGEHAIEPAVIALIQAGAVVNAKNTFDNTALTKCKDAKIARILLEAKADPNIHNIAKSTPLHEICREHEQIQEHQLHHCIQHHHTCEFS